MTWARSPAGKATLAIVAIYAVMIAVVIGLRAFGVQMGDGVRVGVAIAFAVPVLWFILDYWRAIDEAAREAQKWAWFWGGSAGMALAMVALLLQPRLVLDLTGLGPDPAELLVSGGLLVIGAQLIGFFAAWIYWWGSRR